MIKKENFCVGCPHEMGCLGKPCKYVNVPVRYCDTCGGEGAEYTCGDEDICEECLKDKINTQWNKESDKEKIKLLSEIILDSDYLNDIFDELTTLEQAEVLGLYITKP